jgi:septal ring factor EnvC (AmiA/AmiB activator)
VAAASPDAPDDDRIEQLTREVEELRNELAELKTHFADFRKQLE